MTLPLTYSTEQLRRILEQSVIYTCACPAQLCRQLNVLRDLYAYQYACLNRTGVDFAVHQRIAEATRVAHAEIERCLSDVLALEGWDRETLTMPDNLAKRLIGELEAGN